MGAPGRVSECTQQKALAAWNTSDWCEEPLWSDGEIDKPLDMAPNVVKAEAICSVSGMSQTRHNIASTA